MKPLFIITVAVCAFVITFSVSLLLFTTCAQGSTWRHTHRSTRYICPDTRAFGSLIPTHANLLKGICVRP